MINYNESFLKNLEFSNVENKITGGYVYKGDSKQSDVYGGSLNISCNLFQWFMI